MSCDLVDTKWPVLCPVSLSLCPIMSLLSSLSFIYLLCFMFYLTIIMFPFLFAVCAFLYSFLAKFYYPLFPAILAHYLVLNLNRAYFTANVLTFVELYAHARSC